ncbi:hypothetical protein DACRYDRAFT_98501 [Dacryopinax primogenitus]|uniref:Malate dehydrogenase n=1 Tax=Dacryopinax primogenitus (strain DJM 731) TaxID=1858805 RepID=M5G8U6_DACPD|nr:uncharacterized protein DACRYDRAFT_98501 [Dacryopinax primogenitus]EJU04605.1 hypothetical protein DACRYDRAFT_98501 [Dacryopinax primogenitus]
MHCIFKLAAFALAGLSAVSAFSGHGTQPHCNISSIVLANSLVTDSNGLQNLTVLVPPSNASLIQVTIGFGTQNYSCQSGKYVNVGALAQVFDISCIENLSVISSLLSSGINELELALPSVGPFAAKLATMGGFKLADHYFDTSSGSLAPVFNFAVSKGGFAIGKKLQDLPAPVNPQTNVDWLQLQAVAGDAAKFLVREQTAGGQPPATCATEGKNLEVPYAAKYWFFG